MAHDSPNLHVFGFPTDFYLKFRRICPVSTSGGAIVVVNLLFNRQLSHFSLLSFRRDIDKDSKSSIVDNHNDDDEQVRVGVFALFGRRFGRLGEPSLALS